MDAILEWLLANPTPPIFTAGAAVGVLLYVRNEMAEQRQKNEAQDSLNNIQANSITRLQAQHEDVLRRLDEIGADVRFIRERM